jgi:hypothetical protein
MDEKTFELLPAYERIKADLAKLIAAVAAAPQISQAVPRLAAE